MNMKQGGGKYEAAAAAARAMAQADGVILIVLRGHSGHGMSVQMPPELIAALPPLLRDLAGGIERQLKQETGGEGFPA